MHELLANSIVIIKHLCYTKCHATGNTNTVSSYLREAEKYRDPSSHFKRANIGQIREIWETGRLRASKQISKSKGL